MARLKYSVDAYNVEIAPELFTPAEARAEYNRLRNIANKRLWNLKKSEFADYDIVQQNLGRFYGPSKMTEGELYKSLQDVARFLTSKTSSVSGIKAMLKQEVKTLQKHDFKFVTMQNINKFRSFWAEVKANNDVSRLDSEQVAELFDLAMRKKVDPESVGRAFEYWMQNSDTIEKARPYAGDGTTSAKHFEQLMKRRSRRRRS